jgi:SsrA-binding protein
MAKATEKEKTVLVRNRKAHHDLEIEATWEAGIVLAGSEVKSLRESHASINEGWAELRRGELWLVNVKIDPYKWANQFNHEPTAPRKLLLHRQELHRISVRMRDTGLTIVPLEVYLKNGKIKVELGMGRGRKNFEKREAKKEQEARREMDRATSRGGAKR